MRNRALVLTIAVAAAFLGITALPAAAGGQEPAEVTADVECTEPGTFTITWTINNLIGGPGEIEQADLGGAAEGTVSFTPDPFDGEDQFIVGETEVSGDTVGEVTLTLQVIFQLKGSFSFDDVVTVDLDGSCEAPPTTEETSTTSTTTAGVAATDEVRPTFTG